MTKLDNLLQGINLADLDGLKETEVSLKDLQLLRREILSSRELVQRLCRDVNISEAKLGLCQLEKPIRLDAYC